MEGFVMGIYRHSSHIALTIPGVCYYDLVFLFLVIEGIKSEVLILLFRSKMLRFFVGYNDSGNVADVMEQSRYLKASTVVASQETTALIGKRMFTRKYRGTRYA